MKFSIILLLLVVLAATYVDAKKHLHALSKKMSHKHKHAKRVTKKFEHALKATTTSASKARVASLVKSTPRRSDGESLLPVTPKGMELDSHFGAHPESSPYGPQPTLVLKNVTVEHGGHTEHHVGTEVIHAPIGYQASCNIQDFADYEMCLRIQSCDFCTANVHCGWCEVTQRCMPGNKDYSVCPTYCVNGWFYERQSCQNNVHGAFENVAPEASGFISPEMAVPKAHVTTIIDHKAVVHTPVVLGLKTERKEVTRSNSFTGEPVSHDTWNVTTPIVGLVDRVMDVHTHHDQVIDLHTGKKLDNDDVHVLHGWNRPESRRRKIRKFKKIRK